MTDATRPVQDSMFPDVTSARPQGWLMPSVFGGNNAELMAAVAPIYLNGSVLDSPGSTNRTDRVEALILAGLSECLRVARKFVLVKCMEYAQGHAASSAYARVRLSKFHDVPHLVTCAALGAGWVKHDQIVHYTGSGPGGHNIFTAKRARRHHSYLLVFTRLAAWREETP